MVRHLSGILGISLLALVTVGAGSPPNLDTTLAAQRELAAERPYDAEVYNDLGNLLVLDGRREEAQDAYRTAIELSPESALPRFNLGVLLQQGGRLREASAEFRDLLEIDERNARAHYQLGKLNESRKRRSAALEHYAKAFAYDPELTFPRNNPHIIDNGLATEAILMSRRFQELSTTADLPRLYGEPERIARMMLDKQDSAEEEPMSSGSMSSEPMPKASAGSEPAMMGADDMEDEEDEEDAEEYDLGLEEDEDSDSEGEGRRALTPQDLDTGSSIGQAQAKGAAGRPNRRSPVGIGGRVDATPRSRPADRRQQITPRGSSGRPATRQSAPPSTGRPRYRPASRLSTGRLQLELLPPEKVERLAGLKTGAAAG